MEPQTSTLSNNAEALEEFLAKFPKQGTLAETYKSLLESSSDLELCVYSPYNGTFAIVTFKAGIVTATTWHQQFLVPIMDPMTPRWISKPNTPNQLKHLFNTYFRMDDEDGRLSSPARYYVASDVDTVLELEIKD